MFEDNPNQVTTKSTQEVFEDLKAIIKLGRGKEPFYIGVPYRDGLGVHYEGVVSITSHSGITDVYTTVPKSNDVKDK